MEIAELLRLFEASRGITIDSRKVVEGQLFFALQGAHSDGNLYAETALQNGAAYAVIDNAAYKKDARFLLVKDVLACLQQLATAYRGTLPCKVLALTGSNGKTTTKELLTRVLAKKYRTCATQGNFNNHIGVPLTLLSFPRDCAFAIVEMGANHVGEIAALCRIAKPDAGLITNIGLAHLEGFGSPEGVLRGKSELYDFIVAKQGTLFLNSNEDALYSKFQPYAGAITYGKRESDTLTGIAGVESGFACVQTAEGMVHSQLAGLFNAENILAALCVGKYYGVPFDAMAEAIAEYEPRNNRSELRTIRGNEYLLDAYNANPSSMEAAIAHFARMEGHPKIAVLGDMYELGAYAEQAHRKVLEQAMRAGLDKVVTVGAEFGKIQVTGVLHFNSAAEARGWLEAQGFRGALILLKGSRKAGLEQVVF